MRNSGESENTCGCCEGTQPVTPQSLVNRPGLMALAYRAGIHATFLETMLARLSQTVIEIPSSQLDAQGQPVIERFTPLDGLRTRAADDPAIALLDAWATLADVLTFYQERIANEGYLRTATERRSILELGRLVGYSLRPGVASSVFLAFTLDKESRVTIPEGSRVQSVPAPGEMPQFFETSEPLEARAEWSILRPRTRQPQYITEAWLTADKHIYIEPPDTPLKVNDAVLVDFGVAGEQALYRVLEVTSLEIPSPKPGEPPLAVVRLRLQPWLETAMNHEERFEGELKTGGDVATPRLAFTSLLTPLRKAPALHPGSPRKLSRPASQLYRYDGDLAPHLLTALDSRLSQVYAAWGSATAPAHDSRPGTVVAQGAATLRVQAALFGHNLAGKPIFARDENEALYIDRYMPICIGDVWPIEHEDLRGQLAIYLDREYSQIEQGSWLVIERGGSDLFTESTEPGVSTPVRTVVPRLSVHRVVKVEKVTLSFLANSAEVTRLELYPPWVAGIDESEFAKFKADEEALRLTRVYAQSEALVLPFAPIDEEISGSQIELDALYDGLQPGRWLIVKGERTDIPGVEGVVNSERVMLANVIQGTQMLDEQTSLPGDSPHTFIQLSSEGLAYHYKRSTLKIYANVVKATHGETRSEVLGSGDGARPYQAFELRQPPLTYVAAPNAEGVESTLKVRVNDVLWHLAPNLASLAADERRYILKTDDEGKTRVIFGDGVRGARLPTGAENVRAEYRTGIGKGGNVKAGQISLLVSRPLGVKEVINPLPASGGADRESRDQARKRLPLALMALDRLVSVQDYEDFARTFAGIGKASAVRLSDGLRTLVHLTIAGEDDVLIDVTSDLYRNFVLALRRLGDPNQPFAVKLREKVPLVVEAGVKIHPDYLWEKVEGQIRLALLDAFGFESRELGQDVTSSEVLSVVQKVRGVDYVDLDVLDSLDEARLTRFLELQGEVEQKAPPAGVSTSPSGEERLPGLSPSLNLQLLRRVRAVKARPSPDDRRILLPAQILYLDPQVQDTLILKELL